MPSTYTDNGGIELPANGEQASTWGNTVNDNMQIVDRLTNGVGAITLSGTTHALTTSNGVVSDGQYKVLVLGGSPSGTNTITVAPNDAQHLYIVKNNSGQTAAFTQGSGANISVLSGTTKIIYCDGAGSGAAVVDVTGSLDLGSLIVGGTTVTATGRCDIYHCGTKHPRWRDIYHCGTKHPRWRDIVHSGVEHPRRCDIYHSRVKHLRWRHGDHCGDQYIRRRHGHHGRAKHPRRRYSYCRRVKLR